MTDVTYTTQVIGCVTISIEDEVTWWTHEQVYAQLTAQALDLDYLQAHKFQLFIHVRSDWPSGGFGSGHQIYVRPGPPAPCNQFGDYSSCTLVSILTLQANPNSGQFVYNASPLGHPERLMAHEFGHAWTHYFRLKYHNGSWDEYVAQRNIEPGSYASTVPHEVIAEDYRICFGTPAAVESGLPNPDGVAPPTPAQCAFLADVWRVLV